MDTAIVVALAIAIPIILFPVALVWYVNIGGIVKAAQEARERRALETRDAEAVKAR